MSVQTELTLVTLAARREPAIAALFDLTAAVFQP